MRSPNTQKNPVNNYNQSGFMPYQYTPLSKVSSPKETQQTDRTQTSLNRTNPEANILTQRSEPALKTAFSLNLTQNSITDKQNTSNFSSRPSLEIENGFNFKKPSTSRDPTSPHPIKNSEQLFSQVNYNKPNNKVDTTVSKFSSQNQNSTPAKPILSPEEYQKTIKSIESQLKFEEKYSNQLYRQGEKYKTEIAQLKTQNTQLTERGNHFQTENNKHIDEITKINEYSAKLYKAGEDYKSQIVQLKSQNCKLTQRGDHFESQNNKLLDQIKNMREEINNRDKKIIHLDNLISEKDIRISKFEAYSRSQNVIISDLNSKIQNFKEYYNTTIQESRIQSLSEDIAKLQKKCNDITREKNRLGEELRLANEKLTAVGTQVVDGNKQRQRSQSYGNTNDMANKMIVRSFEGAIKQYQSGIEELRITVEQKTSENSKLNEQIVQYKKQMESMREEKRLLSLKHSASSRRALGVQNVTQENQNRVGQLQNEISSLNNRLKSVETRYLTALKEINKKDEFLKEYLVGRAKGLEQKESIESLLQQYVNTFDSRFALNEKVQLLEEEIKKYEGRV